MNSTVDVVIPIYRPDEQLVKLVSRLEQQTVAPGKIFLMHTDDRQQLDSMISSYENVVEIPVAFEEFDHGDTRDRAIRQSKADIVICMTQDALPANKYLIEELIKPMQEKDVAMSYARQLPREDSRITEKYIRAFNYPAQSRKKSLYDQKELGIKTYFCSNVCAAYKRDIYIQNGGFEKHLPLNEDMLYAAKSVLQGWSICYVAEAKVIHSHNYTYLQQFRRNFDIAVSQARYPEIFENVSSEKEGIHMVKKVIVYLLKKRQFLSILYFVGECAAKYLGFFLGKRYKRIPLAIVKKCSLDTRFWESQV